MTKNEKAELEMEKQAFNKYMKDPRAFWEMAGYAILSRPASKPVPAQDKDGNETANSQIQRLSYETLKNSLKTINDDTAGEREPTELEMILMCQAIHARDYTPAAVFIRDTLGAKPVEKQEMRAEVTDYSELSDEELRMLYEFRENNKNKEKESCATPEISTKTEPEPLQDAKNADLTEKNYEKPVISPKNDVDFPEKEEE